MATLTIDNQIVEINGEKNLLELIRKTGIDLPTFCYHSHLSSYGACRMCVVEIEGRGLTSSCTTPPQPGVVIHTNSARVRRVRKMALELLLANHDRECTSCVKNGACKLQSLADKMGIKQVRFGKRDVKLPLDESNPSLVRDPNKCILCGDCVRACREIQGLSILDFAYRGSKMQVGPAYGKTLDEVDCVYCGQCGAVCPTGAITVKIDNDAVWKALEDPEKIVVGQIAPAVRVAIGESFGLEPGVNSEGKIVAALKRIGFDKVFDTSFAADLTVIEEANEFLKRFNAGEKLPIFTSCCPAWVKYAEQRYPTLLSHLSTCRSPQQMFGSVMRNLYAKELGVSPDKIFVVSIMPCTAKKFEASRPEFSQDDLQDIDAVLSTRELAKLIREQGLDFENLQSEGFDVPFGEHTGAGVIFGYSGGVAEAALRYAYKKLTGEELKGVVLPAPKEGESLRDAEVSINGTKVRIAAVNSLLEASKLVEKIQKGEAQYELVEVMACPGGCVGGGGQPAGDNPFKKAKRGKGLESIDKDSKERISDKNTSLCKVYADWLKEPNSEVAHNTLHTRYHNRKRITDQDISIEQAIKKPTVNIQVCVGTCCYQQGSYDTMDRLYHLVEKNGLSDSVKLSATFCFEKCGKGPNISINGKILSGVHVEDADRIFEEQILPLTKSEKTLI